MKSRNVALVDSSIDVTTRDASVSIYIHVEITKIYLHLETRLSAVFSGLEG